jgi:hypothetical protein
MAESGNAEEIPVVSTYKVLAAEYALIWPDKEQPGTIEAYRRLAYENGQAALCLSGGGIRSASFALGVLQALSAKKLLTGFHYLSTVSGGGYIGSWLQRWIFEERGDVAKVMDKLGAPREPVQVKYLRENSNFLTPKVGFGSNDTWAAVAICVRNVILNWLVFGPMLMLAALVPPGFVAALVFLSAHPSATTTWIAAAVAAVASLVAGWFVARGLPSYRRRDLVSAGSGDGWLYRRILLPLILWAIATTSLVTQAPPAQLDLPMGSLVAIGSSVTMGVGVLLGALVRSHAEGRRAFVWDLLGWALALVALACAILVGVSLLNAYAPAAGRCALAVTGPRADHCWRAGVIAFAAPVWLLGSHFAASILFVGFRLGGKSAKSDADREWLARVSGIKVLPILTWFFAAGCGLILNWLLADWWSERDMTLTGFVAVASGWMAVGGGKSRGSGTLVADSGKRLLKRLSFDQVVAVATFLFLGALFVFLGRLDEHLITVIHGHVGPTLGWAAEELGAPPDERMLHPARWHAFYLYAAFGLLLLILVLTFSQWIKVNRFSLNGLYRNRLDRGFLGSARERRIPDPFTGFNSDDNIRMSWLIPGQEPARHKPESDKARVPFRLYPVINVTLNATQSENLAWQERKAAPFVFTPKYSGGGSLDPVPAGGWTAEKRTIGSVGDVDQRGAYIDSLTYGGNEPDFNLEGSGISFASAMSISGAAASPNMGYHTSPATAFLMTLFNVRLGAWLPNPARAADLGDDVGRSNPTSSLAAILKELAGLTSDEGKDIYLSDGGHFENLGVYEMLRRRCAFILVSDAGADPGCTYFDLGGLVRKAKVDFDIDVSFAHLRVGARAEPPGSPPAFAWALGSVTYPEGTVGAILYLKPTYVADLPVDIQAYGNGSKTFPHESTGDQFFGESQFESYRHLGCFLASRLGTRDVEYDPARPRPVQDFFLDVLKNPQDAADQADDFFVELSQAVSRLHAGHAVAAQAGSPLSASAGCASTK